MSCKQQACAIQSCLRRAQYQEGSCRIEIDALYECCRAFYRRAPHTRNTHCPAWTLEAAQADRPADCQADR